MRRLGRRGNVALVVALVAVPLLAVIGIAVDGVRAWLLQSRLNTALDAAALAGARNINATSATRDAEVAAMFWTNMGMRDPTYSASRATAQSWRSFMDASVRLQSMVAVDESTFEVRATASLPTTFARVIGRNDLAMEKSARAKRADLGMELALVLDITGSMDTNCTTPGDRTASACGVTTVPRAPGTTVTTRNSNIDLLRVAAADMVNILYGNRDTVPNLWVSVVPYTTTVNIGPARRSWLSAQSQATLDGNFTPTTWRGCVEARVGYSGAPADGDRNDYTPAEAPFQPFYYRSTLGQYTRSGSRMPGDNDWARKLWTATTVGGDAITENWQSWRGNYQVGPNVGCPQTPILPLTISKTTVLDTIQGLRSTFRGGTMANMGLLAGWFTLSPRWRATWALGAAPAGQATALPLDYNARNMRKAIVLMTDGANNWFDSPYGFPGACTETTASTSSYPTAAAGFSAPGPAQAIRPVACPSSSQTSSVVAANGAPPIANNADYTGYGRLAERRLGNSVTTNAQAQTEINNRMSTLCTTIKARGILIYTVVLDTSGSATNSETRTLYQGCASAADNYFFVSAADQLRPAFQAIGSQLANLRLSQ